MNFDQGRQSFADRDFDTACNHFRQAITADPQFHEAHRYLAEAYEKLGFRHRARKAWEGLLRITTDDKQISAIKDRMQAL